MKKLDQFFTKQEVANTCVKNLLSIIEIKSDDKFLEPSAGNGDFVRALKVCGHKCQAIDLEPKNKNIQQGNFFHYKGKEQIVFGNPPFGKRSKLALEFFHHAATFADVIAFIVPVQWKKWSIQSKLPRGWRLVLDETLEEASFYLPEGKDYKVRCCFQVWTTRAEGEDLKLREKPCSFHPDFEMWLYNNTRGAEKFFDYDWDVAVPRQGYVDYSRREFEKSKCEKTTQWIFFKAKNEMVLRRIINFDFFSLSKKNLITPGWGKADFVAAYKEAFSKKDQQPSQPSDREKKHSMS